jgi:hypothetical protein
MRRAFNQAPDSLRKEAGIPASEVWESTLEMRFDSGLTTYPLASNQNESAYSRAGLGVFRKAAVISETRSDVLANDDKWAGIVRSRAPCIPKPPRETGRVSKYRH